MEQRQKVLLIRLPYAATAAMPWGYARHLRKEVCVAIADVVGTVTWTTCPIRSIEYVES